MPGVAIQGIANLFSVRINVLSSQCATFTPIEPADNSAQHELFVGLILQYHYVGLDKSNIASPTTDSSVDQPGNSQLENTMQYLKKVMSILDRSLAHKQV